MHRLLCAVLAFFLTVPAFASVSSLVAGLDNGGTLYQITTKTGAVSAIATIFNTSTMYTVYPVLADKHSDSHIYGLYLRRDNADFDVWKCDSLGTVSTLGLSISTVDDNGHTIIPSGLAWYGSTLYLTGNYQSGAVYRSVLYSVSTSGSGSVTTIDDNPTANHGLTIGTDPVSGVSGWVLGTRLFNNTTTQDVYYDFSSPPPSNFGFYETLPIGITSMTYDNLTSGHAHFVGGGFTASGTTFYDIDITASTYTTLGSNTVNFYALCQLF